MSTCKDKENLSISTAAPKVYKSRLSFGHLDRAGWSAIYIFGPTFFQGKNWSKSLQINSVKLTKLNTFYVFSNSEGPPP